MNIKIKEKVKIYRLENFFKTDVLIGEIVCSNWEKNFLYASSNCWHIFNTLGKIV